MLNTMREGAKSGIMKFIFFGLMTLATFGLVLTDAGGFFNGGFGRQTIAKIGDVELSLPVFNSIYSRELSRSNIPPETARTYGLPQMVLGREINRITFLQAAHESDLRVGDVFVAQNIKKQLDDIGLEGNDKENLDYVLRQMNITEGQLIRDTREGITTGLISMAATNMGKSNRQAVEALYRFEKEKRIAEIITVSPSDITDVADITPSDIDAYYQANQQQFTTLEKRSAAVLHVTTESIARDVTVDDEMVEDYYQSHKSEYKKPDQYQFSQAIFDTKDDAQAAFDKVESGDITALQSDTGRFVESDWFMADGLPSDLQEPISTAKAGDVIGPIETSLGFHVIKLQDAKKDSYTSLADAKKDIQSILRNKEVDSQIYHLADDLDNAVADGATLADLAKQYDISLKTISNVNNGDLTNAALPQNGDDAVDVMDTIFILDQGEVSPVIELSDGSFMLLDVTQITPQETKPLASVQQDIKTILMADRKNVAVQDKAVDIMAAYNKGEGSLTDLARKNNVSFSQTRAILRTPQDGTAVTTNEANLLFSLTPKNDISSLRVGNDVKIVRLANIERVDNVPADNAEVNALAQKISEDVETEIQQQFLNAWKEDIGVNINMELFQQAFLTPPSDQ